LTIRLQNDFWFIKKIVYLHRYLYERLDNEARIACLFL